MRSWWFHWKWLDSGLVHEYRCDDGSRGRIRIPPGVENGERIPAMDTDGTPFNLIIEVERHDQFMRRGADLHTELPIHRADAVRRTVVSLGTLRGPGGRAVATRVPGR